MQKLFVSTGLIVGSIAGGYIPVFFGAGFFSLSSIISSAIGGLLGIYIGYKIGQNF